VSPKKEKSCSMGVTIDMKTSLDHYFSQNSWWVGHMENDSWQGQMTKTMESRHPKFKGYMLSFFVSFRSYECHGYHIGYLINWANKAFSPIKNLHMNQGVRIGNLRLKECFFFTP
jgi:hypothetical protein